MSQTYVTLQGKVQAKVGDTSSTLLTKIKAWLNDAQFEIAKEIDVPSLITSQDVATGTTEVGASLGTDFLRELTVCLQGTSADTLTKASIRFLDTLYPDLGQVTASYPRFYHIDGYKWTASDPIRAKISFAPVPDTSRTVRVRYVKIPTDMSADSDYSDMSFEYQSVMVDYAIHQALMELESPMQEVYWNKYKEFLDERKAEAKVAESDGMQDIRNDFGRSC